MAPGAQAARFAAAPARLTAILVAAGAVAVAVVLALVVAAPLPSGLRRLVCALALLAAGVGLMMACIHRYRRSSGRRQVGWMLYTFATGCATTGYVWVQVAGAYVVDGVVSPGDVSSALALVLACAGLAIYPDNPAGGRSLLRNGLDGVVLGGSLLLIASDTLAPRLLAPTDVGLIAELAPSVAPVFATMLVSVTWITLRRAQPADRLPIALSVVGFALLAATDVLAALQRVETGAFVAGTPVSLGWALGLALPAVGVWWSRGSVAEPHRRPSTVGSTVVLFLVFVAATLLHLAGPNAGLSGAPGVMLAALLVAVAVRQILLIGDNERLRRSLEQRVRDRSTELAEVTQRTDLLVDSVGDGVYGVDDRGLVTFVNPAAAQLLGYRPRELLGRDAHVVFHAHDGEPVPARDCYVSSVSATGIPTTAVEDTYLAKDGHSIPVDVTASPLARDIRARGAVVVFRDATQRREVDRLKNEFVSMVSHELKTPLTAIRGSLGLLAGGALGDLAPAARRMVEIAMESSERLTRMINQILDLERIESGTMAPDLADHAVPRLLATTLEQMTMLGGHSEVEIRADVRDGWVRADADHVERIMINLVGNAIKFSPRGGVVEIATVEHDQMVEISVSDSGRGVPPEQLETIFTRFHQVDSSDARDKGGTGLGLAISRGMADSMGGRLWAENRPEGGAVFRLVLPTIDRHANGTDPGPRDRTDAPVEQVRT